MTQLKLNHNSKTETKTTRMTRILNYDSRQPNFIMSSPATAPKTCCDFPQAQSVVALEGQSLEKDYEFRLLAIYEIATSSNKLNQN